MKFESGSIWRKWDLHVHTPASFHWQGPRFVAMSQELKTQTLEQMIAKIESLDVAVFGIMDYWTFDGYLEVRRYLATRPCSKTILPGIELRIEAPVDYRLNIHALFAEDVTEQTLLDFRQKLTLGTVGRPLSDEGLRDFARKLKPDQLKKHGIKKEDLSNDDYALNAGAKTAEITKDSFFEAFEALPPDKAIAVMPFDTSDGLSALDWNKHITAAYDFMNFPLLFETRHPTNVASFLGIEIEANKSFLSNFQAALNNRPRPVTSGSDAHKIDDYGKFPSQRVTWYKADPTFRGLLQVIKEPQQRVHIGALAPKLQHIDENKTKYIDRVSITKKQGSAIEELWFDNHLELNPDLIAIIGNKGSGKSALGDIISLLGDTRQSAHFSFLSKAKFCDPRMNKASHFEGTLHWKDGTSLDKSLSDGVDVSAVERVKYIPQSYLESLCNESSLEEGSEFERELKHVIFSHVRPEERLSKSSLDEVVEYKSAEIRSANSVLSSQLSQINAEIAAIEDRLQPENRSLLENLKLTKEGEIAAHNKTEPALIAPPEGSSDSAMQALESELKSANESLVTLTQELSSANDSLKSLAEREAHLSKLDNRLDNLERSYETFLSESAAGCSALGLDAAKLAKLTIDRAPIDAVRSKHLSERAALEAQLDEDSSESLFGRHNAAHKHVTELQDKLDEPARLYQEYLKARELWEKRRDELIGTEESNGSLYYIIAQLALLDTLPEKRQQLTAARLAKVREIHANLEKIRLLYKDLFSPVQKLIDGDKLIKNQLQLRFDANIVAGRVLDQFFEYVSNGAAGSFYGVEEGKTRMDTLIASHVFDTAEQTIAFIDDVIDNLTTDHRHDDRPEVGLRTQLRRTVSSQEFYDFLFGLGYLRPRYSLKLGEKELRQLSPGERGTLLLIFYLLLDKGDIPLVIDQPEENLDNQTVYTLLVPVIKAAKQRRQVIIVTHNSNLAVVCDADQIIHASIDRQNGNKITYSAGSIEAPHMNKYVVDVLEGTEPAFNNRRSKYIVSSS